VVKWDHQSWFHLLHHHLNQQFLLQHIDFQDYLNLHHHRHIHLYYMMVMDRYLFHFHRHRKTTDIDLL
tara:strand:- start:284 stop:487 length:204 start_codon:yes stop_codon:yes gene_type:complete